MGDLRNSSETRPDMEVEVVAVPPLLPGLTATGLDLPRGLAFDQWERVGAALGAVVRATPWAIGDWLNYGETHYGETYAQGMEVTGLDYATLATSKWVASRIEPSRRRESLSWSAHREVAGLEPEERDRWLDQAERGDGPDAPWTRARLRQELAKVRGDRTWSLDEAVEHLVAAVRAVKSRWPKGARARKVLGERLCALGEEVLSGGDLGA